MVPRSCRCILVAKKGEELHFHIYRTIENMFILSESTTGIMPEGNNNRSDVNYLTSCVRCPWNKMGRIVVIRFDTRRWKMIYFVLIFVGFCYFCQGWKGELGKDMLKKNMMGIWHVFKENCMFGFLGCIYY